MNNNIIFVTHNPITRLQLSQLCKTISITELIHIETRDNPSELKLDEVERRIQCRLFCSTYYTEEEIRYLVEVVNKVVDLKKNYTLVVPHLYNHLFAILVELKAVKELIYVEEGNLSLGLVKKIDMQRYTYRELVKKRNARVTIKQIQILSEKLFEHGANQRVTLMPFLEMQPFAEHPKLVGTISVSKRAFPTYENNRKLDGPSYGQQIEIYLENTGIIYLPNLYCKIPSWIDFRNIELLKKIVKETEDLIKGYDISQIILKPHPSTPEFFTQMMREHLKNGMEWKEFKIQLKKIEPKVQIIEAAALPFRYAIFQCFSSALSYTKELSPQTEILYPYTFNQR